MPDTLVEVWQCNAAGRYRHQGDQHPAPLDPNFTGLGRCLTGADGAFAFVTIKPGAYPWGNHHNAWRPAHIHFSVFGRAFAQRLVTQMYFPGDPLFAQDPIFNSARRRARERLVAAFDLDRTRARVGARLPLGHRPGPDPVRGCLSPTPPQTVGPFFSIGLPWDDGPAVVEPGTRGRDRPARHGLRRRGRAGARRAVETWQADPAPAGPRLRPLPDRRATAAGRSSRASPRRPAARRRTSPSPCSRAGCWTASPTRIYFGDEPEANAADPLLSGLEPERRRR